MYYMIDAFSSNIGGWRAALKLRTETVLDGDGMAWWSGEIFPGMRYYSDVAVNLHPLAVGSASQ